MDERYRPIVERVVAATISMDVDRETWERSLAIQGMLDVGVPEGVAAAERWIKGGVRVQDSGGQLNFSDWVGLTEGHHLGRVYPNSVAAAYGYVALGLHENGGDQRYIEAARRQASALVKGPRTSDGGFPILHGVPQLWIDSLYLYCPLLARLGALDNDEELAEEVVRQFDVHLDHLHDARSGLIRHVWCEEPDSFPESTYWSRGNGWFSLAVVDCARYLGVERMGSVIERFRDHLEVVMRYQDQSGLWRNVLDDPRSRLETSGSVLFAYGVACAVEQGFLDDRYNSQVARAVSAATVSVTPGGEVGGTALMPGGPGVSLGAAPLGQGLYLMAVAALDRIGALEDAV